MHQKTARKTPEEHLRQPYARVVIPVEDGFHGEILEFPGCFAQGDSVEEAYSNLENSAASWIEACQEQGQDIPAPSANAGYSGRIVLRLPKSIHRQAAVMADRDGVSLNQFLLTAVAARVGAEDLYASIVDRIEFRLAESTALAVGSIKGLIATAASGGDVVSLFDVGAEALQSTAASGTERRLMN